MEEMMEHFLYGKSADSAKKFHRCVAKVQSWQATLIPNAEIKESPPGKKNGMAVNSPTKK